ncbi:MAG: hypothetical protein JW958_00320 [Candidatus Eisenbacteria bacterium]|nr:hypothetical protein [Candidatus Eisenbacteria bacterium]
MRPWIHLVLLVAALLTGVSPAAGEIVFLGGAETDVYVKVLSTDTDRVSLECGIGAFSKTPIRIQEEVYYQIDLPGEGRLRLAGRPALPILRRSLRVPDDARMELVVLEAEYEDFTDLPIAPSKGHIERSIDPGSVPFSFDPLYEGSGWFPAEPVTAGDPYVLRDLRGMDVSFQPFLYDPSTRTLRAYKRIVAELRAAGPGSINVLRNPRRTADREWMGIYEKHFLGGDRLSIEPSDEMGDMLVIAHADFLDAVAPLVDWKNQKGIRTVLLDVAAVGSTPEEIHATIRSVYDEGDLSYVLLVGDADRIPSFSVGTPSGPADPDYACVAGDDDYPDLFIGRFSATDSFDVATQVVRTIAYERDMAEGAAHLARAAGVASDRGPGDDGEYDYEHMGYIREDLLDYGYDEVDEIYDPGATVAEVTAALEAGRGLVNYCGHGDITHWGTTYFGLVDVGALDDRGELPFIFNVACLNGAFRDNNCLAEAWVQSAWGNQPVGAVGIYASSITQYWDPPMCAQDEFIDLLADEELTSVGGLCFAGACRMIQEYETAGVKMFRGWNLFADPSLRIRTDAPEPLAVTHASTMVGLAATFRVTVSGTPGVLCALSHDGVYFGSALTDAGGVAIIPIEETLPVNQYMKVTATAFNRVAYVGSVFVTPQPICDVYPASFEVSLLPGEKVTRYMQIANNGTVGSLLHYNIGITDDPGAKNITGSTCVADITEYTGGETFDIVFTIANASPDWENLKYATIDFPIGVTVNSSTDFVVPGTTRTLYTDGTTGNGAEVHWSASGLWGEVQPNKTAVATVNVTIVDACMGDLMIEWELEGDGWGSPPHEEDGVILVPPAGPQVLVLAPNGGEEWGIGEERSILWGTSGCVYSVRIECSRDGGAVWETLETGHPDDGSYLWEVEGPVSEQCLIRVATEDGQGSDESDGEFTIFQPIEWVSAEPESGVVLPGEPIIVELEFDAGDFGSGQNAGYLVIANSAGDPIVVPVRLRVESAPIDPDLTTFTVNTGLMLSPDGSGDSVLTVAVAVRDTSGAGVPGIPPGGVVVTASAVSAIGEDMTFCVFGTEQAQYLSEDSTDAEGEAIIEIRRVGGCGTITLNVEVAGIPIQHRASAEIVSPDINGDGAVNYQDTFLYIGYLTVGSGWCGNLSRDSAGVVSFNDTMKFLPFLASGASCP